MTQTEIKEAIAAGPGDYLYTPEIQAIDLKARIERATELGRAYAVRRNAPNAAYECPVHEEIVARQTGWEIGGTGAAWQTKCREAFMAGFRA